MKRADGDYKHQQGYKIEIVRNDPNNPAQQIQPEELMYWDGPPLPKKEAEQLTDVVSKWLHPERPPRPRQDRRTALKGVTAHIAALSHQQAPRRAPSTPVDGFLTRSRAKQRETAAAGAEAAAPGARCPR